MNKTTSKQTFKRLSKFYIIALSIIALLTLTGVFFIQWLLYQQSSNTRVINVAGQQRMFSENLSKIALIIQLNNDTQQRLEYVNKLSRILTLWKKHHQGLQLGNAEFGLPGNNSTIVKQQFADLQPHYQAMDIAAQNLLAIIEQDGFPLSADILLFIKQIVTEQVVFVQKMDEIVFQYEKEALAQLNQVKLIAAILAISIFIVLLLEGFYIFRPTIQKIQQIIQDLLKAEETLRNIVEGVSATTGADFLQQIVEYLAKTLQIDYVFIAQLKVDDPNKMKTIAGFAHNSPFEMEYDLNNSLCEEVLYGNTLHAYPQAVQQAFPLDTMLVSRQIESFFGTPLFDSNGSIIGLMIIMDGKPAINQKLIKSMLQIFGTRTSAELERVQALEALQQERASLTQHIRDRTAELRIALEKLRDRTAELTLANAELARAAKLKTEFIANMSHELRTPLLGILPIAEALQEDSSNPQQAQPLNMIVENARRLHSLIKDILDFAKIDEVELEINPISTKAMSELCLRKIKILADKKQIKVTSTIDSSTTIMQADERYLKQILVNLLNNAVKFTSEKGEVKLDIRSDAKRKMFDLSISDTGKGIAEKDMERLFKPFVQLDGGIDRKQGGIGLGLTIVHRLTEMHGGRMTIESEVGKGSRFTISLPWRTKNNIPLPTNGKVDHQPEVISEKSPSGAIILLADDNLIVTQMFAKYLQTKNYQVVIAHNGLQAIEKTKEYKPELIIMDMKMPNMDGLEAIRHIRANAHIAKIPIIALTGLAVPGDKKRCLEAGANDYLNKPVNFEELMTAIKKLLSHH